MFSDVCVCVRVYLCLRSVMHSSKYEYLINKVYFIIKTSTETKFHINQRPTSNKSISSFSEWKPLTWAYFSPYYTQSSSKINFLRNFFDPPQSLGDQDELLSETELSTKFEKRKRTPSFVFPRIGRVKWWAGRELSAPSPCFPPRGWRDTGGLHAVLPGQV